MFKPCLKKMTEVVKIHLVGSPDLMHLDEDGLADLIRIVMKDHEIECPINGVTVESASDGKYEVIIVSGQGECTFNTKGKTTGEDLANFLYSIANTIWRAQQPPKENYKLKNLRQ